MYPPAMPIFSEPNEIIAERGCEYARSMFHNVARGTQKIGIKELPKYIAMGGANVVEASRMGDATTFIEAVIDMLPLALSPVRLHGPCL